MIHEGQILGYCQSKQKHSSGTLLHVLCSLFDLNLRTAPSVWMCQTYETILCVIMSQKLSIGSRPICEPLKLVMQTADPHLGLQLEKKASRKLLKKRKREREKQGKWGSTREENKTIRFFILCLLFMPWHHLTRILNKYTFTNS